MTISLYRKYRPQTFDQVVGQEHIEQTLKNAVADGTTTHAYLFCGPRGTGKTTTARLLAKALLCENGPTADPCGTCDQCLEIAGGTHPDVSEMDAASRTGVENVRDEIIGRVAFAPTRGRYKIYIIDEVHMLSTAAFNALLKTLEEPPSHVVFIMCTTDPHKVPETIQSRCQRFDFHRIAIEDIVANLRMICEKEGFEAQESALEMVARQSLGGMRDAISTLEQLAVFTRGRITEEDARSLLGEVRSSSLQEIAGMVADRDMAGCFDWVARFAEGGTDIAQFAHELTAFVRDLYVLSLTGSFENVPAADGDERAAKQRLAASFGGSDRLARVLTILGDLNAELKTATDARLSLEVALTRMARPKSDLTLESLAERVEALEAGGVPAAPAARAAAPSSASVPTSAPVQATRPAPVSAPAPAPRPEPVSASVPVRPAAPTPMSSAATTAPAPARPKQPATPQGNLDAGTVSRIWRAASRAITGQKVSLVGALANARALPEDDGIVIELPHDASFSRRILEEPENHMIISQSLREAAGRSVAFRITVSENTPVVPRMPVETMPSVDLFEASEAKPAAAPVAPASEATPAEAPASMPSDDDDPEYVFDDGAFDDDEGIEGDPSVGAYLDDDPAEAHADEEEVAPRDPMEENLANLIFGTFEKN